MSIATNTRIKQYTLASTSQALSFPYYFLDDDDLKVVKTDQDTFVDTTLVKNTDYTVSGEGVPAGGTVTMIGATVGDIITIYGNMGLTQPVDLQYQDQLPSATLEQGLDRLTMFVQELWLAVQRTVRVPNSSAEIAPLTVVARTSKFPAFDENGDFELRDLEDAPENGSGVAVVATGSSSSRLLSARFAEFFHVKDFGVVGDGVTDDTAALQAGLDLLSTYGGTIRMSGCTIKVTDNISIPAGVTLLGSLTFPDPRDPTLLGTYTDSLLISGNKTVTLHETSAIKGFKILRYGATYPQAAAAVATWTGTAVTIAAGGHGAFIQHMTIVGFARAVDMGTASFTEQTRMEYCAIDCLAGVKIVSATDRLSIVGVECWPTASIGLASPVDADYRRSGIAFELAAGTYGIDAPTLSRCFSYAYATGFKLTSVNGASLIDCVADYTATKSVTVRGLQVTGDSVVTMLSNFKSYRATYGIDFGPNNSNHGLFIHGGSIEYAATAGIYCTAGFGTINGVLIRHTGSGTYTTYGVQVHNANAACRFFINGCLFDNTTNAYAMTGTSPGDTIVPGRNICTGNGTNIFLGGGCNTYASAATLNIPAAEDVFFVSGTTTIDDINASFAHAGRRITLIFLASVQVTAGSTIKLSGGSNLSATANDTLTLVWSGSYWSEVSRTVI